MNMRTAKLRSWFLAGAVASCLYTIVAMIQHENASARKLGKQ